jgi:hypothetical protein
MSKKNTAIFLFDDVEVLDFAGPWSTAAYDPAHKS